MEWFDTRITDLSWDCDTIVKQAYQHTPYPCQSRLSVAPVSCLSSAEAHSSQHALMAAAPGASESPSARSAHLLPLDYSQWDSLSEGDSDSGESG